MSGKSSKKRIVLVTGANRGLGRGTAEALAERGDRVIFVARKKDSLKEIVGNLLKKDLDVASEECDVSQSAKLPAFCQHILKDYGRVDVLINNAGIFIDNQDDASASILKLKPETITKTLTTNSVAPFLLSQGFLPSMKENGYGRIVNVSSGMGQLGDMNGSYGAYRMSKTALNAVTRVFAAEGAGHGILVNSICPGWVKTDMGGAGATRSLKEGIFGILWAANLENDGPTGGFFRDGKSIPW